LNQVPNAVEPAILTLNGLRVPLDHVIDWSFKQQKQSDRIRTILLNHALLNALECAGNDN